MSGRELADYPEWRDVRAQLSELGMPDGLKKREASRIDGTWRDVILLENRSKKGCLD